MLAGRPRAHEHSVRAQAYFASHPAICSNITLTGPPTVTMYSAPRAVNGPPPTTCSASHHFGHWCPTSISRGSIIAIIVVFSILLLALLVAIPVCLLGMARSRRNAM